MKIFTKRNAKIVGLSLTVFSFIALLWTVETYFFYKFNDVSINFWQTLNFSLKGWLIWAFFVPFIIELSNKYPLKKSKWHFTVPIHLTASILFSFLGEMIIYIGSNPNPTIRGYLVSFLNTSLMMIFVYWVITGISHLIEYQKKNREQKLKTAQTETKLTQVQLKALKSQLHPHFLFNTLHTITGLMFEDVFAANKMVAQLSDLLRMSLDKPNQHEVILREELEFIELYLNIQKTRFKDRLQVELNIEKDTADVKVPSMILQPLVENAVQHGISPNIKIGRINIASKRENGFLILEVHDNGKGMDFHNENKFVNGVGIPNTLERLKQLYPGNHNFELKESPEGGLAVIIKIPCCFAKEDTF